MRAIRFHRTGEPDVLVLDEVPAPTPRPGEVLLRIRAAGINWADTRFRRGEYFVRPQFPQICGMEAAGEVLALGEGVTGLAVGQGVDVILEMVGGTESYKRNLACLAPLGRLVVYGAANGDTRGQVEPIGLMHKNHTVTGYYLTPLLRRRDLCAPALAALADDVVAGRVKVLVGALAPLADAARLHREMEARGTTGKLVLSV